LSLNAAALTVPAGAQTDVDGGLLALPCCDLTVKGTVTDYEAAQLALPQHERPKELH
jgi:hypothetical protein